MKYNTEQDSKIEKFYQNRDSLIMRLMNGEITKREYILLSHSFIIGSKSAPYETIDCVEKGMYNYQYYNTMAKYYKTLALDERGKEKHNNFHKTYLKECNYYYDEKDKITFRLLRHMNYENIEAYFIEMKSEKLKNVLYEVVLNDYKFAVLHSKSIWILNALKKQNVFSENIRKSVIDYYVNDLY